MALNSFVPRYLAPDWCHSSPGEQKPRSLDVVVFHRASYDGVVLLPRAYLRRIERFTAAASTRWTCTNWCLARDFRITYLAISRKKYAAFHPSVALLAYRGQPRVLGPLGLGSLGELGFTREHPAHVSYSINH
jgi:hypothetical protein